MLSALEFFSGIGAFKSVAGEFGIEVVEAYDQSEDANKAYLHNFGVKPSSRNLDSISAGELPEADLWWLSPPCKPFSRRGKRADLDDARAQALKNLLSLLPQKLPTYFILENVRGFADSRAEELLMETLVENGYKTGVLSICPTQLGVPMQRPRLFYMGTTGSAPMEFSGCAEPMQPISSFIDNNHSANEELFLDSEIQTKFAEGLNVIAASDPQARAICFASSYSRSLNASGSLIAMDNGSWRYFSPDEIIALFGFPKSFSFPEGMPLSRRFHLAGNSVDLRSIRIALKLIGITL